MKSGAHAMSCVRLLYREIVKGTISTGGKSPLFAKHFRERHEALRAHEHGELAHVLRAMRVVVRYHGESSEVWQAMFEHLIEVSYLALPADVTTAASRGSLCRTCVGAGRGSMGR
jgi:hypothetical protein